MSNILEKIKEKIPGTQEYAEVVESQKEALEVMNKWSSGELVYSHIRNRVNKNRDFYLGKGYTQFNSTQTEGELRVPVNVGATALDLMVYLLSNNPPSIQAIPKQHDRQSQIEASIAEDLVHRAFSDASFHRKFRNSAWMLVVGGFAWWYPFWNNDTEFGKSKNRFDFTLLNPLTTRVFYEDSDYEKVSCFITLKRLTPQAVFESYGVAALPDRENPFINKEIYGEGIDDGKVSVFKKYDKKYVSVIVDNKVVDRKEHGLDFTPLVQVNNKFVVNDAHGHDDIHRMLPVAQELNMLISAASEIARDLAWPVLLEYNNALGGKSPPKMRGHKVPVRRSDKGEAIEYMINPAQIGPMLQQIVQLMDMFHFVSLMPKAAAGVFDSTVTSGFQARIAMQPATLNTENKRIDIEEGLSRLAKIALYMIQENDPKAFEIDENKRLTDLHELEFKVVWPDNLPIDIAREVQNLVLGIQNSLTSVTQAIDKYNVLMGLGSSEQTIENLKREATDSEVAPDRAMKVAQVQQALSQIQENLNAISQKTGSGMPEDMMPGGNETNAARAAASPLEEEKRAAPPTAREALPPESLGGGVVGPESTP